MADFTVFPTRRNSPPPPAIVVMPIVSSRPLCSTMVHQLTGNRLLSTADFTYFATRLNSPPQPPIVVKPTVSSRPLCPTILQFVWNSLRWTHWKSSPKHGGFHRFPKLPHRPTPPLIMVKSIASSRPLYSTMLQFVRNSGP